MDYYNMAANLCGMIIVNMIQWWIKMPEYILKAREVQ